MDKKWLILPLIFVLATALSPDDYVCLKYGEVQDLFDDGLPATITYDGLELSGSFTESGVSLDYSLNVNSLSDGYSLVSLIYGDNLGIRDLRVDGEVTGAVRKGDMFMVPVSGEGEHEITLNVLLGTISSGIEETAVFQLPANVSYTQIRMQVPTNSSLNIQPHITQERTGNTVIAQLGSADRVRMTLTRAPAAEEAKAPKIYADVNTLVTASEGILSSYSSITYNVLHTGVELLEARLPSDVQVVQVRGPSDWKVIESDGYKRVQFMYDSARTGQFSVNLEYEKSFSSSSFTTSVPELTALGVEREQGYLGLLADDAMEVSVVSSSGLSRIDPTELPRSVWIESSRPIVHAFKYLSHPWSLSLDAVKHEEVPVLIAAADRGEVLALMSGNHLLTKYTLQVKNNRKQYLEVSLPSGAELWSAFVNNQPVKPVKEEGVVKIPLIKSQGTRSLQSFPVELVYISPSSTYPVWYRVFSTPTIDVPVSQLSVNAYLPEDEVPWFIYSGDLKEGGLDEGVVPSVPMAGSNLMAARQEVSEEVMMDAESMVQEAKEKGVLPVEVSVPREGNLVQLKKVLAVEGESAPVFLLQIHEILSLFLSWGLVLYLANALQSALVESVNEKRVKKWTLAWAVLIFAVFTWGLWMKDWIVWIAGLLGVVVAVIRLVWDLLKKSK